MEAAIAGDSLIGFVLADKYRVIRQIGRGGMGVVYEAEHTALGKRVAIKLMLEKYANDSEAIARFQREALAAGRIGNPHIIDVIDIGRAPDQRAFVVMELLDGMPLSAAIKAGPLAPGRAIAIMRQVLRAVGAAHAKGIIHRDLKPDNIFLVNQGAGDFVKLLDFGISKIVDPDDQYAATRLTTTGVVMGTPLYMAPEQAMGHVIDHQADLYACGVMLYEMLAGVPPFDGATYGILVAKLLTAPPPDLGALRPGLPRALVAAVHRALEKEPERRFASAERFAAALPGDRSTAELALASTIDSGMGISVAPLPLPLSTSARRRWPLIAAAATLIAGAAVAAVTLVSGEAPTAPTSHAAGLAAAQTPAGPAAAQPPPATTGTLEVKTTPAGASVVIDDKPAGTTPIIATLTRGRHQLRVELAGFTAIATEHEVRAGERTSVVIPLSRTPEPALQPVGAARPPRTVAKPPPSKPPRAGGAEEPARAAAPPRSPPPAGAAAPEPKPASDPKDAKDPQPGATRPNPYGTKPNPY